MDGIIWMIEVQTFCHELALFAIERQTLKCFLLNYFSSIQVYFWLRNSVLMVTSNNQHGLGGSAIMARPTAPMAKWIITLYNSAIL